MPEDGSIFNSVGTLILYLLIFVGVLLGAYYTVRVLGRRSMGGARGKQMRIIERIGLDRDKSILLVQVGERIYFLGAASGGVTKLGELEPDTMEAAQPTPQQPRPAAGFGEIIKGILSGRAARPGQKPDPYHQQEPFRPKQTTLPKDEAQQWDEIERRLQRRSHRLDQIKRENEDEGDKR